jgi:hypothetical protein
VAAGAVGSCVEFVVTIAVGSVACGETPVHPVSRLIRTTIKLIRNIICSY